MPAAYDFHLNAPVPKVREHVVRSLKDQGFETTISPNGSVLLKRGSLGLTLLVGAMAGGKMHVSFDVQFFTDGEGSVARLNRSLSSGALKGGALGASRTADLFQNTAHQLGSELHSAGLLIKTTEA